MSVTRAAILSAAGHSALGRRWRMTLSKAITEFIVEVRATKSPATAAAYESDLRRLSKHAKLDTVLHFTPELIRRAFEWESSVGAKLSTLHRKQAAVRQFARWCVRNRILAENPAEAMPTIRRQQTLPRPFSVAEVARLWALELGDPQERVLRALLFYTGLRVSSICGIRLGDIQDAPPTLRVTTKGGKQQLVHMHPKLAELVLGHVLANTDLKPQTPLLRQREGQPLRREGIEDVTKRWGTAAGVRACLPHRFRHTFATVLLEGTKDLRVVQEALGHADIQSTTVYTQVTAERMREAIKGLPEEWGTR